MSKQEINHELTTKLAELGVDHHTLEQVELFSLIYQLGRVDERHLAELRATALNVNVGAEAQTAAAAVA